jgi:hypothetical protein
MTYDDLKKLVPSISARVGHADAERRASNAAAAAVAAAIRAELSIAFDAGNAIKAAKKRITLKTIATLAAVYAVEQILCTAPARNMPEWELAELVRMAFSDPTLKPAALKGYINVLRFAEREKVVPADLPQFIRRHGGLTSCANLASKQT